MKNREIKTPTLILSFFPAEQFAIRAYKLGVSGYLGKDCSHDEFITAIRKITAGEKYVSPFLAERLILQDAQFEGKLLLPVPQPTAEEFLVSLLQPRWF